VCPLTVAVLLATALAATFALVLLGPSSGGGQRAHRERTVHLVSKLAAAKFFDNPPRSKRVVSPGDGYVFVRTLFDKSGQTRVGSLVWRCFV
jgi:hypothetical protein